MKLKLLMLTAFVGFLCQFGYSQGKRTNPKLTQTINFKTNVEDPLTDKEFKMLKEVYGDRLDELVLNKPQRLKDLKNILRNRVQFIEYPQGNDKPYPLLSEVPLFNNYVQGLTRDAHPKKETFNPLKYNFSFYERYNLTFRIDNTNWFIIILSQFN
ncbi:hypothetical protein GZ212_13605 [Mangrovimonas sp. CR14]|uniref:hypothetical protein n=1 Tax=Mangrovimonas sp. CR14 TaxID=2706120 RepID=UPI00141F8C93|nr:hypothetical protein [Mangrovimonas sp. CR14]NIK93193.1 hypothetical protein [Mangrovimonas sp. CR14]